MAGRKKWKVPQPNFAVGDVVLEIDKNMRRSQWNLWRITHVFPGPDRLVRVVDVRFNRREINTLALLESASVKASPDATDAGENVAAPA